MRFLLAIHNAYTDQRSGAARSVRIITEWLSAAGHECRALCTARFDGLELDVPLHLAGLGVQVKSMPPSPTSGGSYRRAVQFELNQIPVTMLLTRAHDPRQIDKREARQFLRAFEACAEQFRPNVVLTYGDHFVLIEMMKRAQRRGITTVFSLRNHGYEDRRYYQYVDHVLTASEYLSRVYQEKIGLRSTGICSPIAWSEVLAPPEGRSFLTFINPALHKGVTLFARLVQMLGDTRPDIPILVVQSAMDASLLSSMQELDFQRYPQVVASPALSEPADIFSVAKLLLVPSLFEEPFGRVAVEAMVNGVPPLVSDRGCLPETVAEGGLVLPVPTWLGPKERRLPSADEVRPWYDAIVGLWDDPTAYEEASVHAKSAANQLYNEDVLRGRYLTYFTTLSTGASLFEDPSGEIEHGGCEREDRL